MIAYAISWDPVRDFVRRVPVRPCPIAGTPEWMALDDADPAKLHALLVAGSHWVLECDLAQRDQHRAALKDAAVEVSTALPWGRIANEIRERDAWYAAHPDLRRRSA